MRKIILLIFGLLLITQLSAKERELSFNFGWSPMTGNIGLEYEIFDDVSFLLGWGIPNDKFGIGFSRYFNYNYTYNSTSNYIKMGVMTDNYNSSAVIMYGRRISYRDKHNIRPMIKYGIGITTNKLPVFEFILGIPLN